MNTRGYNEDIMTAMSVELESLYFLRCLSLSTIYPTLVIDLVEGCKSNGCNHRA